MEEKPKKQKRPKLKIHEVNETNDVKFHGWFSYRHLRILGWSFLILAQIGMIMAMFAKSTQNGGLNTASNILRFFSSLMAPLFLIAAFAQILTAKDGYKRLITVYVAGAVGIFLAFVIVFYHYIVGLVGAISGDTGGASDTMGGLLALLSKGGFLAFNIFVDLALCSLLTFFLNYHPKEHFQGKLIYLFRSFAALPILYEVASITLKILASNGVITLPTIIFPLLTTKPLFAFFVFVALAVFVKLRERHYIKHGKTLEEYQTFLDTNMNRKQISRFLIWAIIIAAIADFVTTIFSTVALAATYAPALEGDMDLAIEYAIQAVNAWGLGGTLAMLLIVPFLFFFDYRKTYKNKIVDIIIPAAGVAVIAIIYLEGFFQLARLSLTKMMKGAEETSSTDSSAAARLIHKVIEVFKE